MDITTLSGLPQMGGELVLYQTGQLKIKDPHLDSETQRREHDKTHEITEAVYYSQIPERRKELMRASGRFRDHAGFDQFVETHRGNGGEREVRSRGREVGQRMDEHLWDCAFRIHGRYWRMKLTKLGYVHVWVCHNGAHDYVQSEH